MVFLILIAVFVIALSQHKQADYSVMRHAGLHPYVITGNDKITHKYTRRSVTHTLRNAFFSLGSNVDEYIIIMYNNNGIA